MGVPIWLWSRFARFAHSQCLAIQLRSRFSSHDRSASRRRVNDSIGRTGRSVKWRLDGKLLVSIVPCRSPARAVDYRTNGSASRNFRVHRHRATPSPFYVELPQPTWSSYIRLRLLLDWLSQCLKTKKSNQNWSINASLEWVYYLNKRFHTQ